MTKSLEVAEKIYDLCLEEVSRARTKTNKDHNTNVVKKWAKTVEARKEIKVQLEQFAMYDRQKLQLEEDSFRVIKSFTSSDKHVVLSSKPNNQTEFTFS